MLFTDFVFTSRYELFPRPLITFRFPLFFRAHWEGSNFKLKGSLFLFIRLDTKNLNFDCASFIYT